MKKIIETIYLTTTTTVAICVFLFLVFSLWQDSLVPGDWTKNSRTLYLILSVIAACFSFFLVRWLINWSYTILDNEKLDEPNYLNHGSE